MFDSAITTGLVSDLNALKAKEKELKDAKKVLVEAERIRKWENSVKAENAQYVVGSRRKATEDDLAIIGHSHGEVCSITCYNCGTERIVNVQDAGQTRLCKACKEAENKAKTRARRLTKRLGSKSKEQLEAEIAEAQAALETLKKAVG
jgi:hypothetical protein